MIKICNKSFRFIAMSVIMALCTVSCDENIDYSTFEPDVKDGYRAIVINEGQFGYGTSSLTMLNYDGSIVYDVFRKINNRPMGDVAQSMTKIGDYLYVPLNNSRKIEVFDSETFQSIETMSISEDVIPMYVQHLGGDSIAVTDQMWRQNSCKLMIMDINHGTTRPILRRYVSVPGQTYQMTVINNKLFVGGSQLAVFDIGKIDSANIRFIMTDGDETIQTADFSKLVTDKYGKLWVLTEYWVYCIDPVTEKVIHTIDVGTLKVNARVSSIDCSTDGGIIFFNAHTSVYSIDVDNISQPKEPVIAPKVDSGRTIYHLCVSKENTIFMCDVLYGSLSRHTIREYDLSDGTQIREFPAGIFPHAIYFK